jgi:hypothetical protein
MPTAQAVRKTAAHPIADHAVDAIGRRIFNYYFSGLRNAEEDSDGNRTLYFIDTKGRTVGIENALGQRSTNAYGEQGTDHD